MKKKLHLKGWSDEEIEQAHEIIKRAEKNKHPHVKRLENSLYWFTLIIGIIGTVFFSLILVPIFIINNNFWSYVLTAIFGLLLGALMIIIIKDMDWLKHHHHLSISLLIPLVALFNFIIVVNRVNLLNKGIGFNNFHNPILMGVIYLVCFILPYAIFLIFKREPSWT